MKKKDKTKIWIVPTIFMALMVTSVFAVLAIPITTATPDVIYVPDDYSTIQAAVNAADTGDTIIVRDGTYTENVNVDKRLTIRSENGAEVTIVQAANSNDHVFEVTVDYVNISGFTVKDATGNDGIPLNADSCDISNNNITNNWYGISLRYSNDNDIFNCNISDNMYGIHLHFNENNTISSCELYSNSNEGIYIFNSNNNTIFNCSISNSNIGTYTLLSNNNAVFNCNISNNNHGINLQHSNNNNIYLNNFINNINSVYSYNSSNIWNSTSKITYAYNGSTYTNYLGNYWDDYSGSDANGDGIGDTPYNIDGDKDSYPLIEWFENYFLPTAGFDTGSGTYPSIMGNHTGTIKPNHTVIATKLYTYPCEGTGGHTEYAEIRNATWNATATWERYAGDWHNITFDKTVVLLANEEYNYTIRTGSYPQIIHRATLPTENGWINCTKFTDANGRIYTDWIPAIRLE